MYNNQSFSSPTRLSHLIVANTRKTNAVECAIGQSSLKYTRFANILCAFWIDGVWKRPHEHDAAPTSAARVWDVPLYIPYKNKKYLHIMKSIGYEHSIYLSLCLLFHPHTLSRWPRSRDHRYACCGCRYRSMPIPCALHRYFLLLRLPPYTPWPQFCTDAFKLREFHHKRDHASVPLSRLSLSISLVWN